ncbi:16S rRNA (uracil(1498)-N(3))-methyltransferase [Bacillus suaedaesalsae]|uniref:Ribosomal RNA small subunit methyltransferase E n=1 Tax=Bacillus suaedaesalsae TaxID=2810349 RepID=A0ABS2DLF4_9BACI|nr:16S rRNA (uracil(1498)-N(3))-methyltransferase [Bacillus suaedaesalsae]MBM6619246.1 16S rRNA (uracil(1498)-N(3))-methyltransferase [Bacillus suaedaesalsae]
MQRYFLSNSQFQDDTITIGGEDAHHIARVMRMEEGSQVYCCNEEGKTAVAEITNFTNEAVTLHIVKWIEESKELPIQVSIASGLPKGDKLELIIQKATELGAHRFVPFNAARSIVKWDEKKGIKKVERWGKIAKEAAEQSHRSVVPTILKPVSFDFLLKESKNYDYKIVAYEEVAKTGEMSRFANVLTNMKPGESILVAFGPEGGLTEKEIVLLEEYGFIACGLGPRILRTETAPLYVLSAISYHFELQGVK